MKPVVAVLEAWSFLAEIPDDAVIYKLLLYIMQTYKADKKIKKFCIV